MLQDYFFKKGELVPLFKLWSLTLIFTFYSSYMLHCCFLAFSSDYSLSEYIAIGNEVTIQYLTVIPIHLQHVLGLVSINRWRSKEFMTYDVYSI